MNMDVHVINVTRVDKVFQQEHYHAGAAIGALAGIIAIAILRSNLKGNAYNDVQKNKILLSLYITAIAAILPAVLVVLAIFYIYRLLICVILRLIHKSKFVGLLNGPDSFWLLKDASRNIVNVLLIVNFKPSFNNQNLLKAIRTRLTQRLQKLNNVKLMGTTHKFLGYYYLLNQNVVIDEYLGLLPFEKYCCKDALHQTLSDLEDIALPRNDRALWEVLVGNEEINWGCKKANYPVIVRFNHCLGDGVSLMQLLLASLGDDTKVEEAQDDDDPIQRLVRASIRCMHFGLVLFNLPPLILRRLLRISDKNVIHGARLSGQKIFAWKTEERGKYVKTVRTIKRRLRGAGFFDVVASAVASSLKDFLEENGDKSRDVSVVVPAIPNAVRFKDLNCRRKTLRLNNQYSVGELDLPIRKVNLDKYGLIERLGEVMRRTFVLKNSYQYQVNYWLLNIVATVLPEQILQPLLQSTHSSIVLSNLPGPQKMLILENNSLEDVVFWIPHRGLTGVGVSIFTYDNRFQMGISIDKVYGVTEVAAEKILNGVFKYLDCLESESLTY